MTRSAQKKTPIRQSLQSRSALLAEVKDGIGALKKGDRRCLARDIRSTFDDSLYLDLALQSAHPQDHRWDYLLGHGASDAVIGLEPHPAREGEVREIIRKKQAAQKCLSGHLKQGKRVAVWLWVAAGKVLIADTERTRRLLDEHGIQLVGRQLLSKHLPAGRKPGNAAQAALTRRRG